MSENTKIEWATHSWSPWRGCTKVSEGCANCYAETLSKRNPEVLGQWGKGKPRVFNADWKKPLRWNRHENGVMVGHSGFASPKRPRIFPSLCDWLDDEVPIGWLAQFLKLIHDTPNLDWLLLTKRPENWRQRLAEVLAEMLNKKPWDAWDFVDGWLNGHAPQNVWFGVSVENQERADRVPYLLQIPARVRWLSVEPLLGPLQLNHIDAEGSGHPNLFQVDALTGRHTDMARLCPDVPKLDWVVIGGESGPEARSCNVDWIRHLVHRCRCNGVPVFVKQLGTNPVCWRGLRFEGINHPKGGDPAEWPEDLRIRQYPVMPKA